LHKCARSAARATHRSVVLPRKPVTSARCTAVHGRHPPDMHETRTTNPLPQLMIATKPGYRQGLTNNSHFG
jgi:hypothetical protein